MASFSRLPNELISEVWGHILEPNDVESFALVSKLVYAIGRPFVEEHNKLKIEYSFVKIDTCISTTGPAFLLKEVLLRPRVALYVTHFSVECYMSSWDSEREDDDWPDCLHVPYPKRIMELFVEAIQKNSFVRPNEVSRWIISLKEGNVDPVMALLFLLLPNLTEATLMDEGYNGELFQETIQRIAAEETTMFLTRLVKVNISCQSDVGCLNLEWFRTVAALPLVQSIHVERLGAIETDYPTDDTQYFVPNSYSITELTLSNCGLRPNFLFQLLESIKGLKTFDYVEPYEEYCRFEPFWIRVALQANAKHSLESLKILSPRTQEDELLGTLREFTALKELETNVRLLDRGVTFDKLAGVLPASIEKLHLNIRDDETDIDVPRLLEEIVKARSQLVPNLKVLKLTTETEMATMQEGSVMTELLQERCREIGIELEIIAN